MIINALDEVLYWNEPDKILSFIAELKNRYYPHDRQSYYENKRNFYRQTIPTQNDCIKRLEYYCNNGSPIWISGRTQYCDDLSLEQIKKSIFNTHLENAKPRVEKVEQWALSDPEFWKYFHDQIFYQDENTILELTVGAGGGTVAAIKEMCDKDIYIGVDIDFRCAKTADSIAKYYRKNGVGICASLWNLPFDDNIFSAIYTNHGLEECREIPTIIKEASRVLKAGGRLVIKCSSLEKTPWYDQLQNYHFSDQEIEHRLNSVRLYAGIEQIKTLALSNGLYLVDDTVKNAYNHTILVFEKTEDKACKDMV